MDCLGPDIKRRADKEVDIEKGVAIAARYVSDVYAFICVPDMAGRCIPVLFIVSTYNTRRKEQSDSYSSTVTATEVIFNFRHV